MLKIDVYYDYIHWLIIEILRVDAIVSCGLFSKLLRRRRRHVRWTESPPVDLPLSPDRERDIIINRRRREREYNNYIAIWQSQILHTNISVTHGKRGIASSPVWLPQGSLQSSSESRGRT